MRTSIITGATGFIGTHLVSELLSQQVDVTVLVRDCKQSGVGKNVKSICCDMDAYSALAVKEADVFYHLAWEGATGAGRGDERLQIKNAGRTVEALKAAKRMGCKRFIAVGTVYENLVPRITSNPMCGQADFYLLSKQYAHNMCAKLAQKIEIEFVWATIFHPIGRYIKPEQMMAYAIKGLLDGNPPTFGPAQEPYDITAVENIARGLYLLGEKELSQTDYYIGSGKPKRMLEYLLDAKSIIGTSTELKLGARPDDGLRFSFEWYDIEPLVRDTGYTPIVSFEDAVLNTVEWMKSNIK